MNSNAKIIGKSSKKKVAYSLIEKAQNSPLIFPTSGSSKHNRYIVHSPSSLRKKLDIYTQVIDAKDYEKTLCCLNLNHVYGLVTGLYTSYFLAQKLYVMDSYSLDNLLEIFEAINREKITCLHSTPIFWKLLFNFSSEVFFPFLKRINIASSPLTEEIFSKVKKAAPHAKIFNLYGMTETLSWFLYSDSIPFKFSSIDETVCKIVNGELWAQAPYLYDGEYDPLTGKILPRKDDWLQTGDLFVLKDNKLIFQGRKSEKILSHGKVVFIMALEEAIESCPDIIDAYCFAEKNIFVDNVITCFYTAKKEIGPQRMESWFKEKYPDHLGPQYWKQTKEIPRNLMGKKIRCP